MLNSDKIFIHIDAENDTLNPEFCLLLDSNGIFQNVKDPNNTSNHTLTLVLTYEII